MPNGGGMARFDEPPVSREARVAVAPLGGLADAQYRCNTAERLIEDLKREHEATSEGLVPTLPAEPADPIGC